MHRLVIIEKNQHNNSSIRHMFFLLAYNSTERRYKKLRFCYPEQWITSWILCLHRFPCKRGQIRCEKNPTYFKTEYSYSTTLFTYISSLKMDRFATRVGLTSNKANTLAGVLFRGTRYSSQTPARAVLEKKKDRSDCLPRIFVDLPARCWRAFNGSEKIDSKCGEETQFTRDLRVDGRRIFLERINERTNARTPSNGLERTRRANILYRSCACRE